jgi:hypothetical protein
MSDSKLVPIKVKQGERKLSTNRSSGHFNLPWFLKEQSNENVFEIMAWDVGFGLN